MKWSLSSLLRTLLWMAAGISVLAIGLGRYAPPVRPAYHAAAVRYHGVNMHCGNDKEPQPCFLDRETGQFLQVGFSPQNALDYAVCSPWCDERGQFQAVARWTSRAGREFDYLPQGFGLARFTVPEGRLIDQVVLDHVPVGDPCWVPGGPPRIVFTSGDGIIYGYNFEESNRDPAGAAAECARAQPVVWRTTPPGQGLLYLKDLVWPAEAKLGRRMFASISYRDDVNGEPRMSRSALWWLQLSDDATAIEAAGRLAAPDLEDEKGSEAGSEQRLPSITSTADGDLVLAYLSRGSDQSFWELRVSSISIDPATGVPTIPHGGGRSLGGGFLPERSAFSADGCWVYGIRKHDPGDGQLIVKRFSATDVLAQADEGPRRPGIARAEPALPATAAVARADGISRWPIFPRADPAPLLGWANLGLLDPMWLVKVGVERHAGE